MKATEEIWLERIREWKASGLTAKQFAEGKSYRAASLTWRQWQLHRGGGGAKAKHEATPKKRAQRRSRGARSALQPVASAMSIAEVIRRPSPVTSTLEIPRHGAVMVEVGQARIEVGSGFDASLLRDVVRALQGAA